ncbi:MAG: hypothetical protein GY910_26325 [bacterium]|nr:hypothetical protein [bacterium]
MDRIHPSGDIRLRYEKDASRGNGNDNRHRARARLRFGVGVDVTDEVMAGFRVRTGNSQDPKSPHQTFGNEFNSWEFSLDRAYVKYSPGWAEGAWVEGGKMANPFKTNPVYGELVWDADVNPEGGQVGYRWSQNGFAVGGATGIWVLDNNNGNNATILPIQGYAEVKEGDVKVTAAVALYKYSDMNSTGVGGLVGNARGNTIAGGVYASRFTILNSFVSVDYTGLSVPITVVAELINNLGANRDSESMGWAVGAKTKFPLCGRTHKLFYQYQKIEADAVYNATAQDDFQSRASNFTGHIAGIDWSLTKAVSFRTWALFERDRNFDGGTHSNQRIRGDFNFKF